MSKSKQKICGIYAISVYYRWKQQHYPTLNINKHYNNHLQHAWNKYSEENFEFLIIEECKEDILLKQEEYWIEHYKSWDRQYGYNLVRIINGKYHFVDWTTGIYEEILSLYEQGMSKNKIAKQLNVSRNRVYSCLEHNNLHKNEGKGNIIKLTEEVKSKIQSMRDEGKTWEEVLNKTGVSKTQVYRSRAAKKGKYGGGKNIRKSYRTLTPEVKEKAIELRSQGKSWKEIGKIFGVSRQVFYWNGVAQKQPNMVRKNMTPEMVQEATKLRLEGKLWREISSILGVTTNTIRSHINEN
jgi:DNA invertase Pin-like site-specific DNA recombinase